MNGYQSEALLGRDDDVVARRELQGGTTLGIPGRLRRWRSKERWVSRLEGVDTAAAWPVSMI
jgi:hypothetical protein